MSRTGRAGLAALLALAALLRFGGLAHDLDANFVYHPDVAKQMRAVQRFYRGEYYRHIGHKDYDGYPLFHAHLVEYGARVAEPLRRAVLGVLGVPARPDALLEPQAIYWMMLLLNAALSVGAVAVVLRIGRENLAPAAAWGAALLMAVSPADVVASHLATGDAATGFFTTLSLLYSLRVLRLGRRRDYALAAFTGALGFASKYYAAAAFFPLLAAHLARCGPPRSWFSAASVRRLLLTAAAAVAGLVAAVPSLLTHTSGELRDILQAMLVSSQRLDPSLVNASWWERYVHVMRANLPPLGRVLGPTVAAGLAVALVRLRRDPRAWVLAAGPAAYWFLAVGSRAAIHPVYHVAMVAALFLLAAHALLPGGGEGASRPARALRLGGAAVVAAGIVLLGTVAAREVFFWLQPDSQRLAAQWVTENVPPSFEERHGRYTVSLRPPPVEGRRGTVYVRGDLAPMRVPRGAVALARFDLERRPLTMFRNVPVDVFVGGTPLIRRGYTLPPVPPWPSASGNAVLFDGAPGLVRRGTVFELAPRGRAVRRLYVADRAIPEVWVVARAGQRPAEVRVAFGGRRAALSLPAGGGGQARLAGPRASFPSSGGRRYYRLTVAAGGAHARVALATSPAAAGHLLFALGAYREALPLLERGALEQGDVAAAAEALVAAEAAGGVDADARVRAIAGPALEVRDAGSLLAAYGIAADYLDELPYAIFPGTALGSNGFATLWRPDGEIGEEGELVPEGAARRRRPGTRAEAWTPDLLLEPGSYVARIGAKAVGRGPLAPFTAVVTDLGGERRILEETFAPPAQEPGAPLETDVRFVVPPETPGVRLLLHWDGAPGVAITGIAVRPDTTANAVALARAAAAAERRRGRGATGSAAAAP